jgi:photosystem II stability/assembly factor-like uncharacterized protein
VREVAHAAGIPVILTNVVYHPKAIDGGRFYEKARPLRYFRKGSPMGAWPKGLEPTEDELIISKQYPSAFFGINEFVVHPDNYDLITASSYQRRRHVWVLINGGPGSGIHRSSDGGESWSKVSAGLPGKDDVGRIGLAMAPSEPNMLYAIIEAQDDEKGVYRSTDFGQSWTKRSGHMTTSPQYYNEIVVDPKDPNVLYSLDTFSKRSTDGGKTFANLSNATRHVDDHALWINPANTGHMVMGGDGGVYESWDGGQKWRHFQNLPIVQFYRIQPDNAAPFYNVCGGTQDNNSPIAHRCRSRHHQF